MEKICLHMEGDTMTMFEYLLDSAQRTIIFDQRPSKSSLLTVWSLIFAELLISFGCAFSFVS